jgi:hypothetical protein
VIPFRSSAADNLRLKCGEIAGDPAMRAYEILAGSSTLDGLRRCERPDPKPLPGQMGADGCINYRSHPVVIRL